MAILDLDQPEMDSAIKELLKSAQENGIDATKLELIGIECDVSSEEPVVAAFEQIKKRFGRVDAVVASAGRFLVRIIASHGFTSQRHRGELPCPRVSSKGFASFQLGVHC